MLMVDDGAIGSESLEQHRLDVAENLTKMAEKHHTIKPKKMRILPEEVKYLGLNREKVAGRAARCRVVLRDARAAQRLSLSGGAGVRIECIELGWGAVTKR